MPDSDPDKRSDHPAALDPPRQLHEVLDGLRIAMVTTEVGGELRARPLTIQEIDDATLRFLVAGDADWVDALRDGPAPAQVSVAYPSENSFVSLFGAGRVSQDRDVIARLWTPAATAFFDDPDDPRLTVLEVEVHGGEYWDGPGSGIGQALAFVRAVVTGETGELGDHGAVRPD